MKAVYIKKFGENKDLELREVDSPTKPKDDQVSVKVHAAGLNRADLLQVRGAYPPPDGYSPNIPGMEFAGEITEIGSGSKWNVGERVFGITAGEAQAEQVVIHQDLIARIPGNLSYTEAAAVPEVFITAHDALFTRAGLIDGQTLLVHAVGSGVGLAALQLAKARGARVIGTSRTPGKLDKCKPYGLDAGIAAGDPPKFSEKVLKETGGGGADVILDLVGAAYLAENQASLASRGHLILVGLTSGAKAEFDLGVALRKRATIIGTVLRPRSVEEKADAVTLFAREVVPLLASARAKPNLDKVFPARKVVDAYNYLGSNKSFGKVVLEF